jgi:small subunit ribosomal protein S16
MVRIRLQLTGRKNDHHFKIVAADSSSPRDGRFIEKIGTYNHHTKELEINHEILNKFIKMGAHITKSAKEVLDKKSDSKNDKKVLSDAERAALR